MGGASLDRCGGANIDQAMGNIGERALMQNEPQRMTGEGLLNDGGGFWNAPPQRPPGYAFDEIMRLGRAAIGIGSSTMALCVQSIRWGLKTKGLKSHALIAKAMDLHAMNRQNPPQDAVAWDLLASRLSALCHVNRTGSWGVADALHTAEGRDTGLTSALTLYRAQKEAKLMGADKTGGALSGSDEEKSEKKKKKRWTKPQREEKPK